MAVRKKKLAPRIGCWSNVFDRARVVDIPTLGRRKKCELLGSKTLTPCLHIHPQKLTRNPKNEGLDLFFIFKWVVFLFRVSFSGCMEYYLPIGSMSGK